MLKYVPNALTILRFILIPPIVFTIACEDFVIALVLLVFSGITDVLDGAIARKFDLITDFGKLVDPLADKMTQKAILKTEGLKFNCKGICNDFRCFFPLWKRISGF